MGRSAGPLLTIANGPITVELLPEVGARLHRLRAFGQDLLRTPDDPAVHLQDPFGWGAYVMAPWCNRIAAHPTRIGDDLVALAANFPDGSAIHGQMVSAPWHVREDGTLWARGGGDGWPWPYESTLRITVAGAVVGIEQSLTNLATTPMPAGLGLHPWFRRPLEARIDAGQVLRSNTDPGAAVEPVAGQLDLRAMGALPDDLDGTWLDLGDPAVELRWPAFGITATMRARSDADLCVVAASPGALDAVAIEPQTHLPQGLRRFQAGEALGLVALAPGATMRLTTELGFRRSGD
jgi:aldose 1-epimerase